MESNKRVDLFGKAAEDLVIADRCSMLWKMCEEAAGKCYLYGRTDLSDKFRLIQDEIYGVTKSLEKEIDEIMALTN